MIFKSKNKIQTFNRMINKFKNNKKMKMNYYYKKTINYYKKK